VASHHVALPICVDDFSEGTFQRACPASNSFQLRASIERSDPRYPAVPGQRHPASANARALRPKTGPCP